MKKDFKRFTAGTSGDHNYHFATDVGDKKVLVLNNIFRKTNEINVEKAFIELCNANEAKNVTLYWDKTGELTDYSNLDNNHNVVKIDFTTGIHEIVRFDVTKAIIDLFNANKWQTNQRFIITGNNLPTSGISCSITIYYDYKRGFRERNATVPFDLKSASGSIDLSDGSIRMSFAVNNGFGRIPTSVKYYYDSNFESEVEKVYLDNDSFEQINYFTGYGWKTNYHQYVVAEQSNNFMSDGESVGFFTWINAQGQQIIFAEQYYAIIDNIKVFLKKSQIDVDEQGNYIYTFNDVTYPVVHDYACRQLFKLKEVRVSSTEKKIEITDVTDNKMTFEQTTMAIHSGVVIYRLKKVEDNYANALNIMYSNIGQISSVSSVGGNTVNFEYDDNTNIIWKIKDVVDSETQIITQFETGADFEIVSIKTPKNHRDLELKYYSDEFKYKLKIVLDAIGNGYYFNNDGEDKVYSIDSIAKNDGIANGQIVPITDTKKTKVIDNTRYKYISLYEIDYYTRYTKLTEMRNATSNSYLFNYFGECISMYENNYDGEGTGNPQVKSLRISHNALTVASQNVFESNDYAIDATVSSCNTTTIETMSEYVKSNMLDFISKMNSKVGSNKTVYFASASDNDKTLVLECSPNQISKIKDSKSINFVVSAWAQANSYGFKPYAKGYRQDDPNNEPIPYDKSEEYDKLYDDSESYYDKRKRRFDLCAEVWYSSEESDNPYDIFSVSYDDSNDKFQQMSLPIRLRIDPTFTLTNIKIYINYRNNNGNVYVYGVSLKSGNFSFVDYNEYKQIEHQRTIDEHNYFIENKYDDSHLLKTISKTPSNGYESEAFQIEINYNTKKSIISTVDTNGIRNEFTYNNVNGDLLKTEKYYLSSTDESKHIISEGVYDVNTGDLLQEKDLFGEIKNTNTYSHGVVSSTTQTPNASIVYSYDTALNLLETVTSENNSNNIEYFKGENISTSSTNLLITYDYDGFGRIIAIKYDGELYCSVEYKNNNEKIITYANGEKEKSVSDNNDKELSVYYTDRNGQGGGNTALEMKISAYGTFKDLVDETIGGTKYKTEYDESGRALKCVVENKDDSFYDIICKAEYQSDGIINKQVFEHNNIDIDEIVSTHEKKYQGKLLSLSHSAIGEEMQSFDNLQRKLSYGKNDGCINKKYEYKTQGDRTSAFVSCEKFIIDDEIELTINYTYDVQNRLTEVKENGNIITSYQYDLLGRLSRENNQKLNRTYTFTYDKNGNILSRTEYEYTDSTQIISNPISTKNYIYDVNHKDRLVKYDDESVDSYELGNPWTYRGKPATWTNVNRLINYNGVIYEYNYSGVRVSKTINGVKTKYAINDGKIIVQQNGSDISSRIVFYYGIDGVTAFKYNNNIYYYKKNIFDDIIGLYNSSNILVAKYVYDAWGNHKVLNPDGTENKDTNFIGNVNPFRYRSYYYDCETNFYYLQSRYYDPQVGRFLNMDRIDNIKPEIINGLNLFAYCNNNPISNKDTNGRSWNSFWNGVGDWFENAANDVKDFFVEDVYGKVIKPAADWVTDVAAPKISEFFTETIPNTAKHVYNDYIKPAAQAVGKFITETVPDFFKNVVWEDWIVDKLWNKFIVGTVYNKGLKPFGLWVWNDALKPMSQNPVVDAILSLGGFIISIIGISVSTPVITVIGVIFSGVGAILWFRGLFD